MEIVISTSRLNCYGTRVLTEGIDTTQYEKNPVLLWMHQRGFSRDSMPIGRVENLRVDGDKLIGTLVFDKDDEFAMKIEKKMENGFIRMASAGLEVVETSQDPVHLVAGQTRATVTKSRLEEVSIVDIGGNDDALKLSNAGKLLTLAAGEACEVLPLLELNNTGKNASEMLNKNVNGQMNKEFLTLLGLAESASDQEAIDALKLLKSKAASAERIELVAITTAVETAIAEKRLTEAKKDHFIELGKKMGLSALQDTLSCLQPVTKPTDVLQLSNGTHEEKPKEYLKLSDVPVDKMEELKEKKPSEYARLYKAEYGVEL